MNTLTHIKSPPDSLGLRKKIVLDLKRNIANIVQGFGTVFFRLLFNLLFDVEIRGKEHISNERGPIILVSNHVVFYDSFLFHLFFNPFSSLLPLRFMAVTRFDFGFFNLLYKVGIIPLVYVLFGVFIVTQGEGLEKNLRNAKDILQEGGTVTIFPAGSMRPDNSLGEFKRGAAVLASMTNTAIIPIALKRFKVKGKRTRFVISVGLKFNILKENSVDESTDHIKMCVSELHGKIT